MPAKQRVSPTIVVRAKMPDTNSSSGIMIVCSAVSKEGLPIIEVDNQRFLAVCVLHPEKMKDSRVREDGLWQGWHLSMNIAWLFGKALHGQLLPKEFAQPVTANNAGQRYKLLMDCLSEDIEQEQIQAFELMKSHNPLTGDWDIYKAHRNVLRLAVETVREELGLLPAIWIDNEHVRHKQLLYPIYDRWGRGYYQIPVPPGMIGVEFLDDETEGTSIEIGGRGVSIQEPLNCPYAVSGFYEHGIFVKNIVSGYWMPQEYVRHNTVSVSYIPLGTDRLLVVFVATDGESLTQILKSQLPFLSSSFLESVVLFTPRSQEEAKILLDQIWEDLSRSIVGISGDETPAIYSTSDNQYKLVLRFRQKRAFASS